MRVQRGIGFVAGVGAAGVVVVVWPFGDAPVVVAAGAVVVAAADNNKQNNQH
jgi:hypothetical protein